MEPNLDAELVQRGLSIQAVARQLGLGYGTVHRALQARKESTHSIQNPTAGAL